MVVFSPAGKFSGGGGQPCSGCTMGQFSPDKQQGICCPVGHIYFREKGLSIFGCKPCAAGSTGNDGHCHRCQDGEEPSPHNGNGTCGPCREGMAGAGGICHYCSDGSQPTASRTGCQPCPRGTVAQQGLCASRWTAVQTQIQLSRRSAAWFNVVRQASFSAALAKAVGVPENAVLIPKFHRYHGGNFNDNWGLQVNTMVLVAKPAAAHSISLLMQSAVFASFLTSNLHKVKQAYFPLFLLEADSRSHNVIFYLGGS